MKVIKIKNYITVILSDGTALTNSDCTDELYNQIINNQDDDEMVKSLLVPEMYKKKEEFELRKDLIDNLNESSLLTTKGSSVYMEEVSQLSLPQDFAMAVAKAEKDGNIELIETYKNFWTLCSLNPDSRARTNLFWFLNKYGMSISKSGLFVAYRNVELKSEGSKIDSQKAQFISDEYTRVKFKLKKSPKNYDVYVRMDSDMETCDFSLGSTDALPKIFKKFTSWARLGNLNELYAELSNEDSSPVYTDGYTRKFTIKIGEPVSIDRKLCDPVQENTCSRGLHVAGKSWLSQGYFGNTSLKVLVNPADVVAVPPEDSYGKMRCCAYYPVQLIKRDEEGNIVDENYDDGFEDDFLDLITYEGEMNSEDNFYKLTLPDIPEINNETIRERLSEIKKSLNKYVD